MDDFKLITDQQELTLLPEDEKKYLVGMEHPFAFLQQGIVIAKGELVFEADRSVEIKMLRVNDKRKGYGRTFVDYLKSRPDINEIWGESVCSAVGFWFKMDAKFEPSVFEEFLTITEEEEEGFLVPFTIAC